MTTTRPAAAPAAGAETTVRSPSRAHLRSRRRRIVREQWLAVAVLVAAFLVTVVLLGLQWLHAAQSPDGVGALGPLLRSPISEVV
jgi:type VI protein secretion system component VasF